MENNELAKDRAGALNPNKQELKESNDSYASSEEEDGEYVDEEEEEEEEEFEMEEEEEEGFEEEDEEDEGDEEIEHDCSQEEEDENMEGSLCKLENEEGYFEKSREKELSETFVDNENVGEQNCGNRNVPSSSNEMYNEEIQESADVPVSFIAGHYECSDENICIKEVINELPRHSLEQESSCKHEGKNMNSHEYEEENTEFQNPNESQGTEENEKIVDMSHQRFHKDDCSSETSEEATSTKSAFSSPLNKGRNSNLGDIFESDEDPESEAELENHKARKESTENNSFVDYQNITEKQCNHLQELEQVVYEQLDHKQNKENLKEDFQCNVVSKFSMIFNNNIECLIR